MAFINNAVCTSRISFDGYPSTSKFLFSDMQLIHSFCFETRFVKGGREMRSLRGLNTNPHPKTSQIPKYRTNYLMTIRQLLKVLTKFSASDTVYDYQMYSTAAHTNQFSSSTLERWLFNCLRKMKKQQKTAQHWIKSVPYEKDSETKSFNYWDVFLNDFSATFKVSFTTVIAFLVRFPRR